jgi:CubicO group peptidase (beta-lactamase class C family)
MTDFARQLADVTSDFSGVVSVSRGADIVFEQAYGFADRAHAVPNTVDTRFAVASVTKGFTAVTVASLIGDGALEFDAPARTLLGPDLPLIGPDVTVLHLLTHTSGIGDYVDEELDAPEEDYVLTVPVHTLATTEGYLPALDGIATKFPAGERFSYCNSGFVVLALIAERAVGLGFHELVAERVFAPAGMGRTAFLRTDDLPGDAAIGYLTDGRTNVLHLPVRGNGDGGAFTTVADLRQFWSALFDGRLLPLDVVNGMVDRALTPTGEYGLGFWLAASGAPVRLEGGDVGVSALTLHDPGSGLTYSVLGNTGYGAAAVKRRLDALVG